ncbi:MAG: hypothetical protein H6830_02255 [Planctomycetes bacterium]|nr:hypothetical protein [Planctomycetota bacterium]MCB9910595.1 hypothetical protein [Planctomycetota bacterium]HRV82464.1 hypothetical protein [Planctomycetota bacterium]
MASSDYVPKAASFWGLVVGLWVVLLAPLGDSLELEPRLVAILEPVAGVGIVLALHSLGRIDVGGPYRRGMAWVTGVSILVFADQVLAPWIQPTAWTLFGMQLVVGGLELWAHLTLLGCMQRLSASRGLAGLAALWRWNRIFAVIAVTLPAVVSWLLFVFPVPALSPYVDDFAQVAAAQLVLFVGYLGHTTYGLVRMALRGPSFDTEREALAPDAP